MTQDGRAFDLTDRQSFRRLGRQRLLVAAIIAGLTVHAGARAQVAWMSTPTRAYRHFDKSTAVLGSASESTTVRISVALALHDKAELDRVVRPIPPSLGQAGLPAGNDRIERYLPSVAEADAVARYLSRSGFRNVRVSADRLIVKAEGPPSAVKAAFNTTLMRVSRNGSTGMANLTAAQVPASLGKVVIAVLGLQTIDRMHTNVRAATGGMRAAAGRSAVCTRSSFGLNPSEFQTAYGATTLPAGGATAVGIIAEGDLSPTVAALHSFESQNGLPNLQPSVVYVDSQASDVSGECEFDLDSQTIQSVAGGYLANMTFYVAQSFYNNDISDALHQAELAGTATIVNVSLGECETDAQSDNSVSVDDAIFALAMLKGQTFSVSSGDNGSSECSTDGTDYNETGVSYPASSPYVIAVGGTTLTLSGSAYAGETAWSGSGGGTSAFEPKPLWQSPVVGGSFRGVPDVAFDADPDTGTLVTTSAGNQGPIGGTSLASPIFVGLFARLQSAAHNQFPFPGQWIYHFPVGRRAGAFHDITSGSNGAFNATPGWDFITGFGSFQAGSTYQWMRTVPSPAFLSYLLGQ